MSVLIIGAGAIGLWLGAYLARAKQKLVFVARPHIVEALHQGGLSVTNSSGTSWAVQNLDATPSIREALSLVDSRSEKVSHIFLTVKAYSLDQVLHDMEACIGSRHHQAVFVCFQNGLGSEEMLTRYFPLHHIVSATTTCPVMMLDSASVLEARQDGFVCVAPVIESQVLSVSSYTREAVTISSSAVADILNSAGLSARTYRKYQALKWSKMLLNILGNATSAILDMPVEQIYSNSIVFRLEMQMLREGILVMRHLGISPINLPHFPAAALLLATRWIPNLLLQPILLRKLSAGRGDKRPSFYYDVAGHKGQSEVAWLNGAISRRGAAIGVPTPVNDRLTSILTDLVTGAQTADEWRGCIGKLADGLV